MGVFEKWQAKNTAFLAIPGKSSRKANKEYTDALTEIFKGVDTNTLGLAAFDLVGEMAARGDFPEADLIINRMGKMINGMLAQAVVQKMKKSGIDFVVVKRETDAIQHIEYPR